MPLLTSPIDGAPMKQINRYGISIDVCPTTGGIWLDKGELEKLMAFIQQEAMAAEQAHVTAPAPAYRPDQRGHAPHHGHGDHYRGYDDDDDRYRQGHKYGHGKHHKKSKMSRIMDIFDL